MGNSSSSSRNSADQTPAADPAREALLVLAYPRLEAADFEWMQDIRSRHDPRYFHVVAPHFTLVFPLYDSDAAALSGHVRTQIAGARPFAFVLRCAIVIEDDSKTYSHLFLVPDEGFSAVVKLHDRLYTGMLAPHLRMDLPFIPHIGIGNGDARACKALADQLNADGLEIRGRVEVLDLVKYDGEIVSTIERIALE